jgi:hypothetical protein
MQARRECQDETRTVGSGRRSCETHQNDLTNAQRVKKTGRPPDDLDNLDDKGIGGRTKRPPGRPGKAQRRDEQSRHVEETTQEDMGKLERSRSVEGDRRCQSDGDERVTDEAVGWRNERRTLWL